MIAFPSNQVFAIALKENNRERIEKWLKEEPMLDSEDYRTVHTDRGPVRGWGGSIGVRR